jgi:hypothetical protein
MKYITYIITVFIVIGTGGCITLFNSEHNLFHVNDIYYQSWMLDDTEKGTDLVLELEKADEDVEFTSVVFRGFEVDANVIPKGNKTIVKGTYNFGPSIIENYDYQLSGENDMIKYNYRGKEFSYPLRNVRRESTLFK